MLAEIGLLLSEEGKDEGKVCLEAEGEEEGKKSGSDEKDKLTVEAEGTKLTNATMKNYGKEESFIVLSNDCSSNDHRVLTEHKAPTLLVLKLIESEIYNNQTACQLLTNFVILNVNGVTSKAYNLYQAASTAPYLPQLFYWSGTTGTLGQSAPKGLSFLRNAKMTFKIAKYDARGKFLGWDDVKGGTLQCSIQVSQLLVRFPEPVFYELFLQYNDSSGNAMVWPVPVLSQNLLQANPGTGALRRFFLVDGLTGKQNSLSDQPQYVTYASSLTLSVYLPISSPGNTPPFLLTVQYSTVNNVGQTNPQAQVAFAVTYSMDQSTMTLNTNIALGVLGSLSVFLAMLQTSSWSRRSGQQFINFMGQQSTVAVALPSPGGTVEVDFIIYLSLAFAFKALELLHILVVQVTISIFLIDWEKPVNNKSSSGVKNITARDLNLAVQPGADNYLAPWSPILRYGITASIWLAAGLLQVLYIVLIYERFVEDKIRQFVDLCAMSNVSVFILMHRCYGFYIHGRSVHGHTDVSMEVMRSNLRKEAENLCALRGLEPNSEIQTFEFLLTDKVQWQIERIMQPLSKVHKDMDYIVKDKLFLEKIMHYEFQHPTERSIFYNDPDGILFSNVLCYGNELTLLLFDLLLFCVIDLGTQNFVLAAIITFLVQQVKSSVMEDHRNHQVEGFFHQIGWPSSDSAVEWPIGGGSLMAKVSRTLSKSKSYCDM
ncbi:MKS3 protein, partial [Polypterus senegalus]